jgi:beta-galactosidase
MMRTEILLNEKWLFFRGDIAVPEPATKGPVYSQSKTERKLAGPASYWYLDNPDAFRQENRETKSEGWQSVNLPHDYIVLQDNDQSENNAFGYFPYQNAWYRKHFTLPEGCEGKRITLRFDGIAGKSTVYLNGCLMHHNFSAYNTFEVNISSNVYYDKENVLAVYVDTTEWEGWWYRGGGIYRNVHLCITEPCAIDLWGVYAPYRKVDEHTWCIDFETTVINDEYEDRTLSAVSSLLDAEGRCVAKGEGSGTITLRDRAVLTYSTSVTDPLLWDCDAPNLYTVKTELFDGDRLLDENRTRIGFRTVEMSVETGLLVNGKKTYIKGVCAHQDFGLTGLAVPENVARYKIKLIKEMGANGYRTSHYQQTESYMDALDEMGFIVMDEARWFEDTVEAHEQLESLIKRDRNRPSVFFWSTSNEEYLHVTDVGRRLHRSLAARIAKLDKTRPITAAVDRTPDKCTIYDDCGVIGINYNLKIYDTVHEQYPEKVIFASECCAVPTVRDWHFPPNDYGRTPDRDNERETWLNSRERTWKHLMARPYVIGCYQWDAVEHRGEAAWPMICSKSGTIDLFLQKKSGFYQNKAYWTDEPMVHLNTHWNFKGMDGSERPVCVYTNCEAVELFLNGESLGRKEIEKYGHGEWLVPFRAGRLTAKGYRGGEEVCVDTRETTGKPQTLRLTPLDAPFEANGRDLALFVCECLDEQGRVVPDAAEIVEFAAGDGARVVATGSDNCDHTRVNLPRRKMYMGKILVAVMPEKGNPHFELTAMSEHCGCAAVRV